METILVKQFLHKVSGIREVKHTAENQCLSGVSVDSRTLRPGELYVALRGERFDGHRFAHSALQKGAACVAADVKGLQYLENQPANLIVVEDTAEFLMNLSGWYRSRFDIPVIGLTGSSGKTTTRELIAAVLSTRFNVLKTAENENNFIGVPLTLLKLSSETQMAVVEMGTNHPGEISRLSEIVRPTHAVITNIGSGHIGYFGSREAIFREKIILFEGVREGGTIYLNHEDSFLRPYERQGVRMISFGWSTQLDYTAQLLGSDELGRVRFRVNNGPQIQMQIPGRHQLANGLLAAAVGLDMGISPRQVKEGLENVRPFNQRMELFHWKDVLFINDAYNSNPESLSAAIDFLCDLPLKNTRKRFLVVGDMLELGESSEKAHAQIGQYLSHKAVDFVFCYGDDSRKIVEVLENSRDGKPQTSWFETHREIARRLNALMEAGDAVLVKGSRGMTMEKVFTHLGIRR